MELGVRSTGPMLYVVQNQWHDGGWALQAGLPDTRSAGDINAGSQRWAAISKPPGKFAALFRVFRALFFAGTISLLAGTKSKCWPCSFRETYCVDRRRRPGDVD